MHFKKKTERERRNGAVLRRHRFFFFFPRTCSKGRDVFCFLLFVSSFPSHVLCHPPHDEMPEQPFSASNASIGHHGRRRGRGGNVRHMHAAMGRCRVDPAPPAPINTTRTQIKGGGGEKKNREKRRKWQKTGRETDSVERETTETVETKNRGYLQGDRERQTEKRKKKGQKE